MHNVIVISGFDASASAGILLDAHVCRILHVEPHCVLPAFLIQNHNDIGGSKAFSKHDVTTQLEAIKPLPFVAKIGLLQTTQGIMAVAEFFKLYPHIKLIVDTPIISSSGKHLVDDIPHYIKAFKEYLMPLVWLLTPNMQELEMLGTVNEILQSGCQNVLVKGGHSNENQCTDTLHTHNESHKFTLPRIDFTENIRGTGCGLSTAIVCYIAQGLDLKESITLAKQFVFNGIRNSVKVNEANRVLKF